jgi:hypothetical protein
MIQILREVSFYSQRSLDSAAVPAAVPARSEAEGMAALQKAASLCSTKRVEDPSLHSRVRLHLIGLVVVLVGFVDGEAGEIVSHF